jgi:hypothetical protein
MNRDDIIRMAREAGFETAQIDIVCRFAAVLDDFAAVVAAQEREAVIAQAIEQGFVSESYAEQFRAAIRARGNT